MGPDVWKLSSQMSDEQRSSLHLSVKPTTSFLSLSSFSSSVTKYVFLYVIMWPVLSRFGNACVSFSDYFHTCPFPFTRHLPILFSIRITLRSVCSYFPVALSFIVLLNSSASWVKPPSSFFYYRYIVSPPKGEKIYNSLLCTCSSGSTDAIPHHH